MTAPRVVAIVGPTASGKTALGIEVAQCIGGEIVSMDSRQVYRGMDVGTAKPSAEERAIVPHHGLDLVEPSERFNAVRFARFARDEIAAIQGRGKTPILVGGTGFFLRALTHPIFRQPPVDPERRAAIERYLSGLREADLHRWVAALDPATAQRLESWGGRQRLLRAIELPLLTGRPLSWWHANAPAEEPPLHPSVFVLDLPREELFRRIDRRVDRMVRDGLVEEVASLLHRGFDEASPGMNATGYIELIPHVRGARSLEEALELIRKHTRAYARRQLTWFRKQLPAGAVWLDAERPRAELVAEISSRIREGDGNPRRTR